MELYPSLRPGGPVLEPLSSALDHLSRVAPNRGDRLLASLSTILKLKPDAPMEFLRQITRGIDELSTRLRMKGGLSNGLAEPRAGGMLIGLRLGAVSSSQFAQSVRGLMGAGIDIQQISRASDGSAQILIGMGDAPAGAASRALPALVPGMIPYGNLRSGDLAAFWPLLATQNGNAGARSNRTSSYWPARGEDRRLAPSAQMAGDEIDRLLALRRIRVGARVGRETAEAADRPRPAEMARTLRAGGLLNFAYNYNYAVLFPWFDPTMPPADIGIAGTMTAEDGTIIPTFLDLIAEEPPMLGYTPDEIMVPGTDIPLILRPDQPVDTTWTNL